MELLAPVGSKESFITAARAGADAVYVGVPDFNARAASSKINLFDLQVLADYAHTKGIKIFFAFNTLIKHEEINQAVKSISYIEKLLPDGVIVQDIGMAGIIKKYFPGISLHASTQMAVHNSAGVDFLSRNGFKRAVLARELSFSELKIIVKGAPIEIEVFCHGALCVSLSGMCLFSSFIGGLSGNRGRCTQPCRRLWNDGNKRGYIFSPRDLELAGYVNKLKKIGVTSLKIEGRMRSSEYVYRTVKAYRMLIDASDSGFEEVLKEASNILAGDMARKKTACLFEGRDNEIFQPESAQCLGISIGTITKVSDGAITVKLNDGMKLVAGDRLRLSNPSADTTVAFKVKEYSNVGAEYVIPFGRSAEFSRGNPVFKTVDATLDQKDIQEEIDLIYDEYKKTGRRPYKFNEELPQTYTAVISNKWKDTKERISEAEVSDSLWVRFDNISWMDYFSEKEKNVKPVLYLTKENLHLAEKLPAGAAAEMPPFIGQREIPVYKQYINKMYAKGVKSWVLNNVSQFELFKDMECELTAGQFLYCWNAYTAAFLSDMGIKYFTASWEDEFINIRKMCGPGLGKNLVVYLYGFVPVIRSRMITKDMLSGEAITDCSLHGSKSETGASCTFLPVFESGLTLLIPKEPVNIFTASRKLRECGVTNFGIDLCYITPEKKMWRTLKELFQSGENMVGTVKFNFKRGVK